MRINVRIVLLLVCGLTAGSVLFIGYVLINLVVMR